MTVNKAQGQQLIESEYTYLKQCSVMIESELDEVRVRSAPTSKPFNFGSVSLNVGGEAPPVGPLEVTTQETIDKVHYMLMDDRRLKFQKKANIAGISSE
ncbi:hypothetical protein J6590_095671 [Homalodisca vitripennis]|nr:hypothetical protein J6590_095671 [Homalodisca vitripennis]